jgi:AcrR family transcriptional regulator
MTPRAIRPGVCAICTHKDRARIELLRVGGVSLKALARQFDVSKDSVWRHFRTHVSDKRKAKLLAGPARVEQLANAAADESRSLLEQMQIVRSVLLNQFLNAAEACDRAGVANVAGRLLEALRELGRATGELRELSGITINQNTINLFSSPEFTRLQEGLLTVARAHPAARSDIVALLRSLDVAPAAGLASGPSAPVDRDPAAASDMCACGVSVRPGAPVSSPPLIECRPADAA